MAHGCGIWPFQRENHILGRVRQRNPHQILSHRTSGNGNAVTCESSVVVTTHQQSYLLSARYQPIDQLSVLLWSYNIYRTYGCVSI